MSRLRAEAGARAFFVRLLAPAGLVRLARPSEWAEPADAGLGAQSQPGAAADGAHLAAAGLVLRLLVGH